MQADFEDTCVCTDLQQGQQGHAHTDETVASPNGFPRGVLIHFVF